MTRPSFDDVLLALRDAVIGGPVGGRFAVRRGPRTAEERRSRRVTTPRQRRLAHLFASVDHTFRATLAETEQAIDDLIGLLAAQAEPLMPVESAFAEHARTNDDRTNPGWADAASTQYYLADEEPPVSSKRQPASERPAPGADPAEPTAWEFDHFGADLITAPDHHDRPRAPSDASGQVERGPTTTGGPGGQRSLPSWWQDDDSADEPTEAHTRSDSPSASQYEDEAWDASAEALLAELDELRQELANRDAELDELRLLLNERTRRAVHPRSWQSADGSLGEDGQGPEADGFPRDAYGEPDDHSVETAGVVAAQGAAALDELLGFDEVIAEERERLQQLQQQWQDKLRAAELELSQERAKLARERMTLQSQEAELEAKQRELAEREKRVEQYDGRRPANDPTTRRWWSRLGLGQEGS